MKFITLTTALAIGLFSQSTFATGLSCTGTSVANANKKLVIDLTLNTSVLSVSNAEALDGAQLPLNQPIGYSYNNDERSISFEYDWHYTAEYSLVLEKQLNTLKAGDVLTAKLSGDDYDNHTFNEEAFNCTVSK